MTTGWPQNQQDLRWPYAEDGEDRPASGSSGQEHPSGPLPVSQPPQRGRGRLRGRARDAAPAPAADDEDYGWIQYLGAAGPAQEPSGRPESAPSSRRDRRKPSPSPSASTPAAARPAAPAPAAPGPAAPAPAGPPAALSARASETLAPPDAPARGRRRHSAQTPPATRPGPDAWAPAAAPPAQPPARGPAAPTSGPRTRPAGPDVRGPAPAPPAPPAPSGPRPSPEPWNSAPAAGPRRSPEPWSPGPAADSRYPAADPQARLRPAPPARPPAAAPEYREPGRHHSGGWRTDSIDTDVPGGQSWAAARPAAPLADQPRIGARQPPPARRAPAQPDLAGRTPAEARSRTAPPVQPRPEAEQSPSGPTRGPVTARTDSPARPGPDTGEADRPARGRRRGRPVPEKAEPEPRGADKPRGDLQAPPARPARTGGKTRPAKVSRKEAKARAAASVATAARTASVASAATRVAPAVATVAAPAAPVPATKAPVPARKQASAAGPKAGRAKKRRSRRRIAFGVTAGVGCVAAAAAVAVVAAEVLTGSAQAHSITTPTRLGDYVQAPALAAGMGASALRAKIVASSNGEASHVLDAVYDDSTGPAAKSGPLIILFVGGNLTGSAGSFIQSLTQTLPGAFVTSAGTLPGRAACVPSAHGRLAECAWADNDTFGVIASPVLSATALASELRQMRPQLEHARKK